MRKALLLLFVTIFLMFMTIFLALSNDPECIPAPIGLISWWPGDGDATDIWSGRDGTLINGATFATGKVDQAFSFDGVDDFVSVLDDDVWTLGSDPFTIDLWVNFDQLKGRDPFIGHDEGPYDYNKWIFWYDAALRFHINSPTLGPINPVSAPWVPNLGQWYHVAVTRSGNTYALYIDGVEVATRTDPNIIPDPDAPLTIGRAEAYFLDGLTDEVEIYNRALSSQEIQAIYNAGSAGKCKGAPVPDFDIVVSPSSGTAGQGTTVTTNVYISAIAGYDYPVSLSASGQPAGVTIGFNPSTGTPYFTSTMTIQVGDSVTPNTYTIPVTVQALTTQPTPPHTR